MLNNPGMTALMSRDALRTLCKQHGLPTRNVRRDELQKRWDAYVASQGATLDALGDAARGVKRKYEEAKAAQPAEAAEAAESFLRELRRMNTDVQQLRREVRCVLRCMRQRLPGVLCDAGVQTDFDTAELPAVDLAAFDLDAYADDFLADVSKQEKNRTE